MKDKEENSFAHDDCLMYVQQQQKKYFVVTLNRPSILSKNL